MPRAKKAGLISDEEARLPISGKSKRPSQKLIDPKALLPGPLVRVGGNVPSQQYQSADPKHLRERYNQYTRALVESNGNPVPALAIVFQISEHEALQRQVALHDELTASMQGMTTAQIFKANDLDKNARIMLLREKVFSGIPAVSLKALDMINDLDSTSSSSDDSWENMVAMALGRKQR